MNKESLLFGIADSQQGYFTARQARVCGFYDANFRRYLNADEWIKEGWGIYRLARYPSIDRPDLIKWSLWSRDQLGKVQGVWSHATALDFYELCDIMPSKLHMTVPKGFRKWRKPPSLLVLYFENLNETDWKQYHGYRLTTPLKTLLDAIHAKKISEELVEQAVSEARKNGLLTKQEIDILPSNETANLLRKWYEHSSIQKCF